MERLHWEFVRLLGAREAIYEVAERHPDRVDCDGGPGLCLTRRDCSRSRPCRSAGRLGPRAAFPRSGRSRHALAARALRERVFRRPSRARAWRRCHSLPAAMPPASSAVRQPMPRPGVGIMRWMMGQLSVPSPLAWICTRAAEEILRITRCGGRGDVLNI